MNKNQNIPEDGKNPYSNHPGFDCTDCPLRMTVTPMHGRSGVTSHGFACRYTGGHCLPSEKCDHYRKDY